MARYFLDSSALVKHYHQESGSAGVDALFDAPDSRLIISKLAIIEAQSSSARLVREGMLMPRDFGSLVSRLEGDVAAGILTVAAVSGRRLDAAAQIFQTHGLAANIRTLDAIHLATAQALHARNRLSGFVAADRKLLIVAPQVCGCGVIDVS